MNIVDIVLILVIIIAITIGYCRGFLASIIKIGAFICAIIATRVLHDKAVAIIKGVGVIRDFVESGVTLIVEKFGLGAIVDLPGNTLNNLEEMANGNTKYIQTTVETLKKLIGDQWMAQSQKVSDAIGEMLYNVIAYMILLFGTFLLILIIGNIVIKIIHCSNILKGTDQILGAIFTGGITTILMFITIKVMTPFLLTVDNASFVKSIEGSQVIKFIVNFFA